MSKAVDLSSFPLLRIDEIPLHETQTLVQSESELKQLLQQDGIESMKPFVAKLITNIQREIANRQTAVSSKATSPPRPKHTPTKTKKSSGRVPSWISNNNTINSSNTTSNAVVSFVSTPKSSSNFRSRAKSAHESLKARSQSAALEQSEQRRAERTRQVLDTMHAWRLEREKSKAQRDALFEEEKQLRRERRRERIKREKQVRDSMHAAAEEAKSKALELGCNEESAFVAAAAAACRAANELEDGDSSLFNSPSIDSDEDSYLDDETSKASRVLPNALFDDVADVEDCSNEEPLFSSDEQDGMSPKPATDDTTDKKESTLNNNEESCSNKASPRNEDILSTLSEGTLNANLSIDKEQCTKSEPSNRTEAEPNDNRTVSPLVDIAATIEEVVQQPTEVEQLVLTVDNESDCSQLSMSPLDEEHTLGDTITSTASEEIHHGSLNGRKLHSVLPSFSSIFTKFAMKGKSHTDDTTQKELISCMQHQIRLYELHSCYPIHSDDDTFEDEIESCRFYRINSRRPEVRALLDEVFSHYALSEWNELPDHINASSWNLLWTWGLPKASEFDNLLVFQKINRFRHTKGLTRKDLLKKNMQRFGCGHLMPLTFALPHEYNAFVAGYTSINKLRTSEDSSPNFWIVKPIGLSRGRGISVVKDISQVAYSQPIVIQKYISNPKLFLGYKFDLRIYILVTSFSPLEAFIYKEGLARFGSQQYSNKPESLVDARIHLTNSSLQKEFGDISDRSHPAYLAGSNGSGSKVALSWLWKRLEGQGSNTADMWKKVKRVCGKALESVDSDIPNQPNSFELFGFDVIFDTNEDCWLIEVNSSPSLNCDSSLDNRIKGSLIVDTISLVDPIAYDRSAIAEVCKRRITHRKAGSLLAEDLQRIVPGTIPRQSGEAKRLGNFERI